MRDFRKSVYMHLNILLHYGIYILLLWWIVLGFVNVTLLV